MAASALDGLPHQSTGPCDPRHQDAAHGRHGDLCVGCGRKSDLPVIFLTSKDEGNRRVCSGLKMGARRFHPQAVFRSACWVERVKVGCGKAVTATRSARKDPTAVPEGRNRLPRRCDRGTFAYGSRASHLHLEERTGVTLTVDGISDPAGAGHPSRRRGKKKKKKKKKKAGKNGSPTP